MGKKHAEQWKGSREKKLGSNGDYVSKLCRPVFYLGMLTGGY